MFKRLNVKLLKDIFVNELEGTFKRKKVLVDYLCNLFEQDELEKIIHERISVEDKIKLLRVYELKIVCSRYYTSDDNYMNLSNYHKLRRKDLLNIIKENELEEFVREFVPNVYEHGNLTITLTLGDVAENNVGMQQIGTLSDVGFNFDELYIISQKHEFIEFHDLSELLSSELQVDKACVIVIRSGTTNLFNINADDLLDNQLKLTPDKQYYDSKKNKVLDKKARHNLCFGSNTQKCDFDKGKGTIVSFEEVPLLNQIRTNLDIHFGEKSKDLFVEGNYYYDLENCGIGEHGDGERRKVIGIRLGHSFPLCYQWYHKNRRIGKRFKVILNHGDMYVMSEKAVGTDWKKSSIYTLRHCAGSEKYIF